MASLNTPMTNEEIKNLDYFDRAQLYHNVYHDIEYSKLPTLLKPFRVDDGGLKAIKSVVAGQNIKYPYTLAHLIKVLEPEAPRTYQQVYNRAVFLADLCDTSVNKILKSDIFAPRDFIPQLDENIIKDIITTKGTGTIKELKSDDYEPWVDPNPPAGSSDYTDEEKVYFFENNGTFTCNKSFDEVIAKLPKLPTAELIYTNNNNQNMLDISSGYNDLTQIASFNFIKMYENNIILSTLHYSASGIEFEQNTLEIGDTI